MKAAAGVLFSLFACAAARAVVLKTPGAAAPQNDVQWELGDFQVGTRMTYFTLLDSKRPEGDEFLNHLNELDANEDYAPTRLFVDYWFLPDFGVELTWDRFSADFQNEGAGADGDGEVSVQGPMFSCVCRYQGLAYWTPYAGLGLFIADVGFKHEGWHHYGFETKELWEEAGEPEKAHDGKSRHFSYDDDLGWVGFVGADIPVSEGWSVDLSLRYTDVDFKMSYFTAVNHDIKQEASNTIPFDNVALGLGVRYSF